MFFFSSFNFQFSIFLSSIFSTQPFHFHIYNLIVVDKISILHAIIEQSQPVIIRIWCKIKNIVNKELFFVKVSQ